MRFTLEIYLNVGQINEKSIVHTAWTMYVHVIERYIWTTQKKTLCKLLILKLEKTR